MFLIPEWPDHPPIWANEARDLLLEDASAKEPPDTTLENIQEKSKNFPIPFPVQTVRCETLNSYVSKKDLESNINSAYPVLHENVLALCVNFLLHKREFGNNLEQEFYAHMSLLQLIQRLLAKRAVVFVGTHDEYYLLDGTQGSGQWETIGTTAEKGSLNLGNCLSYDEIKLSAFLSVSSYTNFINDGNRYNQGSVKTTDVEPEGIIIGLIGARFEKPKVMEYQEVVITKDQTDESKGCGTQLAPTLHTLFSEFYGEVCFTYRRAVEKRKQEPNRYTEMRDGVLFDNNVYCKRMALSIDTLLLEANERAKEKGTTAFVHVVGIGLGVWRLSPHQNSLFLDTFAKRMQLLGKNLDSVSDVVFAYFGENATSGGFKDGEVLSIPGHPNNGIKIHISRREPHTKLTGEDKGKLLVVSYPWDGNALPGNEFWLGALAASGDPAAAASTQISELHNPHINPKVCAENLRIATPDGVISFLKYRENVKFKRGLKMFVIPQWPDHRPIWANEVLNLLLEDASAEEPPDTTLENIQEKSKNFPIAFPVQTVRCETLNSYISKEVLERNINSAYPVLHENVLALCANFLLHKRKFGNDPERGFYANMTLLQLIQRLLAKRAVVFMNTHDRYYLLDHAQGFGSWETIGTNAEKENLTLGNCLSYDEIKLSAFLSVSSYTNFINDGNRYNQGSCKRTNVEQEGIIIGLIGARLEKPKVMEYQEVVITEDQNDERNGYGTQFAPTLRTLFSGFYGEVCFTYRQAVDQKKQEPNRFTEIRKGVLFDNNVYCKRMSLSIDTLLFEANERAKEKGTTAFVHVVGIGLGVWRLSPHQNSLFLDTFAKRIQLLGKNLDSVSDVVFAYFGKNATSGGFKDGELLPIPGHPNTGIKIHISQREPHTKLRGEDKGKLLVVSYAWDGNALPGNEFWLGALAASGDPAAAASTQISELHNPHINPKVCAENLRIVTPDGVICFLKYRENVKCSTNKLLIPKWPDHPPIWANEARDLLLEDASVKEPPDTTLENIQEKSKIFPIAFPIQTVRCETLNSYVSKEDLERNINSAYPVLHENVLALCVNFLLYKREFGNNLEQEFYANMTLLQLIQRLLAKRAVVFMGTDDEYYLLDGTQGSGQWETIGTTAEKGSLNLGNCLSYDEIKLSAFLSVSSYTNFINNGNRYNQGSLERTDVEQEGIIIGLIGTRFEKPKVMEYQEVVITEDQNDECKGDGTQLAPTLHTLFSAFYDDVCFTYRQAVEQRKQEPNRFHEIDEDKGVLFDNNVYCKRISLSIDTLLLEANERAKEKGTTAFVHVVGIGLGVWKLSEHQKPLFLDTFAKRMQLLGKNLDSVSDVVFAYFGENATSGGCKDGDVMLIPGHPNNGIKIQISRREPHTKLADEDKGKLLVVSYAWDGNALPGNEFWLGSLDGSGDPAAAASTQISELHNPHINPKVCAENLRIATPDGVISFLKYCENVKCSRNKL